MNVTKIETEIEAERITIKMIEICNQTKTNTKSIMELFEELVNSNIKDKSMEILSYIPSILAKKGYDIIKTDPLELKEY